MTGAINKALALERLVPDQLVNPVGTSRVHPKPLETSTWCMSVCEGCERGALGMTTTRYEMTPGGTSGRRSPCRRQRGIAAEGLGYSSPPGA
jgi:hypothetical protein